MEKTDISGGVQPLNLSVVYNFPYSTLEAAIRFFFGDVSLELDEGEELGSGLKIRDDLEFNGSEEEFEHLRVLLTFQHEQFHLRHFTASPIGLLLYCIGGRQYAYLAQALTEWAKRIADHPLIKLRIPLIHNHRGAPEIRTIVKAQDNFGLFQSIFTGDVHNLNLMETKNEVLPAFTEQIETICKTALGMDDVYPEIAIMGDAGQPTSLNNLTGEAVIEGLARCNELISAITLGIPLQTLNRYISVKQHGVYALAIALVEQILGMTAPLSYMVTAKLADWALQAPLFPFLLRERDFVTLEELLPCWRFILLCSRFEQAGFSQDDLNRREREIANELFCGLGWDNPWDVARRIIEARIPPPKSVLTHHYIENLQLGAELRQSEPEVMSYPMMGVHGHKLQAIFNIFQDQIVPGTTGKLSTEPEVLHILFTLLDDSIIDGLLLDSNLGRPLGVARLLERSFPQLGSSGTHFATHLFNILGKPVALRILASLPEWNLLEEDGYNDVQ
jgi:hypothetical protein